MQRVVGVFARYCNRTPNFRVNVVPVTAFAAAIFKSGLAKLPNQISDFAWHWKD
nr:hypothetical protein [uncultured bacterium]